MTPDECMRLPGPVKDTQGKVTKPGHMLIFTAGQSPIYGMQILYFLDPVFSRRAKVVAPGVCDRFPAGITDSLYDPRPASWYDGKDEAFLKEEALSTQQEKQADFTDVPDYTALFARSGCSGAQT